MSSFLPPFPQLLLLSLTSYDVGIPLVSWGQLESAVPSPLLPIPSLLAFAGVVWEENLGARIAPQQWPKQCRVTSTGFVTNAKHGFNDTSSIPV